MVSSTIQRPADIEWTQIVTEGNTYQLTAPSIFQKLVVDSEETGPHCWLYFDAIYTGGIPGGDFQVLKATIKALGDNTEVKTYQYTATPRGEVLEPMNETVRFE